MRNKPVSREQRIQYVLACRNSGLTDYQWCIENGINPNTFYNWVSKVRKDASIDIPAPLSRTDHKPNIQEVVRLDVVAENPGKDILPAEIQQNTRSLSEPTRDSVVEIVLPNATLRFINNDEPSLFKLALKYLGGGLC